MAYAEKYTVTAYNPNGRRERARIFQWQHLGNSTALTPAGDDWLEVSWTVDDFADPVAESRAALRVIGEYGSVLAEVQAAQGQGDAAYMVVWETEETAGTWTVRWWGFLEQQEYRDYPFEYKAAVEVRAVDGITLLQQKLFDPDADGYSILWLGQQIAHLLSRAAPDDSTVGLGPATAISSSGGPGFVSRMEWVPYAASAVPSAVDPLQQIVLPLAIWEDESTERKSGALDALRQLAGRFFCRVFQSRGRWLCVQPHRYTPDAAGEADVWAYSALSDLDAGASGTATALTVAKASARWNFARSQGPERVLALPVREAVSVYDYEPDLEDVLENGSFEDAGDTAADAVYWTKEDGDFDAAADLFERLNGGALPFFEAAAGNIYVMKVTTSDENQLAPYPCVYHTARTYVPGGRLGAVEFSGSIAIVSGNSTDPTVRFGFSDGSAADDAGVVWWVRAFTVELVAKALRGRDVPVYVAPLGSAIAGAVDGTVLLPAGTVLEFWNATASAFYTARLTEDARVGDDVVMADLDETLVPADLDDARGFYWYADDASAPYAVRSFPDIGAYSYYGDAWYTFRARLPLHAPDGTAVTGYPYAALEAVPTDPAPASAEVVYYDAVGAEVIYDGATASEIARSAARVLGHGQSVALPSRGVGDAEWLLGDGPGPDAYGGLSVRDGTGTAVPTTQGADTGWQVGVYGADPSSGRTIDALHALDVVRSRGVALERWALPVLSEDRDGAAVSLDPEHVVRHTYLVRTVRHAFSGAAYVETPWPLRAGDAITLLDADDDEEAHTVASVSGLGPFVAYLDGTTLAQAYPIGSRVKVTRDLMWDRLVQVPGRGLTLYEGTEQYLDESVAVTETTLQQ